MTPTQLASGDTILSAELDDWGAVTIPIGEPISQLRGRILAENADGSEAGIWECTPGTWQRTVMEAELCTIFSGRATFTPEGGDPMPINPGDVVYFPANSKGVWQVHETIRKSYLTYK